MNELQTNDEYIFSNLVKNAFSCLHEAIDKFSALKLNHSVIYMCMAIELLLKAILCKENWEHIVSGKCPDRAKFEAGDFKSIGLEDAIKKLTKIDGYRFKDASKCFHELRKHRNRMVHFYHKVQVGESLQEIMERFLGKSDESSSTDKKKIEDELAGLYCQAWFYLHKLLTDQWQDAFLGYGDDVSSADRKMLKKNEYLKHKYDLLKVILGKAGPCPTCKYESLREKREPDDPTFELICAVCNYHDHVVEIMCNKCGTLQTLIPYQNNDCTSCSNSLDVENLIEALSKDGQCVVHCNECQSESSVFQMKNGKWLCSSCYVCFDADDIDTCSYCECQVAGGNLKESFFTGCGFGFCTGEMARRMDRDD